MARSAREGDAALSWSRLASAVLLGAVATAALLGLAGAAGAPALTRLGGPGPASSSDVLVVAAAGALGAAVLWTAAGAAVALLAAALRAGGRAWAPLERLSARVAPALVRRLAAGAVGLGVLGGVAAPAVALPATPAAASTAAAPAAPVTSPAAPALAAGPAWPAEGEPWRAPAPAVVPPARAPAPALGLASPQRPGGADDVVVRRGDTLWAIAERSLPAGAGAAEVAAEWPRWWRANHDVVGDDPDLLLPGQVLRAPGDAGDAADAGGAR